MNATTNDLPQLGTKRFLMDGGLETTLIFENGFDLPQFAAFPLLDQKEGRAALRDYYLRYIDIARKTGCGFILEGPTWRASSNWGAKLGYGPEELERINTEAISFLTDLKTAFADETTPMLVSGCIGPQGDGYNVEIKGSAEQARGYHTVQIGHFKKAGADLVAAYTINYAEEAVGITRAALEHQIPAVISFTVETDGRLPSGQPLGEAITQVDRETENGPVYYMINCAHPSHFKHILSDDQGWLKRIRGIRANASKKSHAELDEADELDRGDLAEFGEENAALAKFLPNLNIFGGCCGTDHQHIQEICNHVHG